MKKVGAISEILAIANSTDTWSVYTYILLAHEYNLRILVNYFEFKLVANSNEAWVLLVWDFALAPTGATRALVKS